MDALLTNASWLLAVLFIVGACLCSVGLNAVLRRLIKGPGQEHNTVLGILLSIGSIFCAIVIALAVFVVWDHLTTVRQAEADQGATLIVLYHDAEVLPQPARREVESAIRDYTTSVIEDEFPTLAGGRSSERTERSLSRMNNVVHRYLASTSAPDQVSAVARSQYTLVLAGGDVMPGLMWVFLIGACVLLLTMASPLFMENARYHRVGSIMLGFALGAALFLIVVADHPFSGPLRVSPEDLSGNLHTYSVIDGASSGSANSN
ncbi:MAG TPA: hypothetical protein VOB72_04115 [Candidatus Dormibacteraeota bacterium]|nr:hypothetical protein [Candidatus Dormibacteraeota bacterium]